MRFYLFGPKILGVRPGVSFTPDDLRRRNSAKNSIHGSFVYVVRGDHNMAKIGVTTNPTARIAQLRTGSAFPIDFAFIGCTPGDGYDIEREAHAILARQRCAGEWFDVSPELAISAVTGAAARLGRNILPLDERTAARSIQMAANGGSTAPQSNGFLLFVTWISISTLLFYGIWTIF